MSMSYSLLNSFPDCSFVGFFLLRLLSNFFHEFCPAPLKPVNTLIMRLSLLPPMTFQKYWLWPMSEFLFTASSFSIVSRCFSIWYWFFVKSSAKNTFFHCGWSLSPLAWLKAMFLSSADWKRTIKGRLLEFPTRYVEVMRAFAFMSSSYKKHKFVKNTNMSI